jgi:hypothetical protein
LHEGQATASGSSLASAPGSETATAAPGELVKEGENAEGAVMKGVKPGKGKGKAVVEAGEKKDTKEKGGKQSTLMAAWGKKG